MRAAVGRLRNVYMRDYKEWTPSSLHRPPPTPRSLRLVVLLQGINAAGVRVLKSEPFIRDNFLLSDDYLERAQIPSGNVTLISLDLCCGGTWRLPFRLSRTGRDAVFVDIVVDSSTSKVQVLRIANTQLEDSVDHGGIVRTTQLSLLADFLAGPRPEILPYPHGDRGDVVVVGGIVAGDFCAEEATDAHLPYVLGFRDLWQATNPYSPPPDNYQYDLSNCGKQVGHTWGYQPFIATRPPRRLDKILATGDVAINGTVNRVGIGSKAIVRTRFGEEMVWISDHFGLKCNIFVR